MSAVEDHIRFTPKQSSSLSVQVVSSAGVHTLVLSGEMDIASGSHSEPRRSIINFVAPKSLELRPAEPGDTPLLGLLIREAAFWRCTASAPPLEEALADPAVARYVERFGRPGDGGVIALLDGVAVGAAWWRYFDRDGPGYGFVQESVPEVSIAVLAGHRGRGVGTELLNALRHAARVEGIARLSLSVERDNPAFALYERVGFRPVGRDRGAQTMVLDVAQDSGEMGELLLPDPPLCDDAILLREWSETDVPAVVAACQDPAIVRWTAMIPSPYGERDALEWISGQAQERRDGRALELAITGRRSGELLGAVALSNVSLAQRRSGVGYWLAPQARGHGHATAAVRMLGLWAFEQLGLGRLELFTDVENVASQNVAERCGFRREGLLRAHLLVRSRGERRDSLVFGLIPADLRRISECRA